MLIHCVNVYKQPGSRCAHFSEIILVAFTKFGIISGFGERGSACVGLCSVGLCSQLEHLNEVSLTGKQLLQINLAF